MGQLPASFWVYDLRKFEPKGWMWERDATFDNGWGRVRLPDTARIGVRRHIFKRKQSKRLLWTRIVLGLNPVSVTRDDLSQLLNLKT